MELRWNKIFEMRGKVKGEIPSIWKVPIISDDREVIIEIIKNNDKVLEVGAHKRSLEKEFKDYGCQVTYKSMDIDRSLFHDYYSLDEIKEKFDVIICLEVIEHMPAEAGVEMLTKIHKLLKPDGKFIISTPNIYHPVIFREDPTHITPWGYSDLIGSLISLGFKETKIYRIASRRAAFGRSNPKRIIKRWLCRYLDLDFAKRILVTATKPR